MGHCPACVIWQKGQDRRPDKVPGHGPGPSVMVFPRQQANLIGMGFTYPTYIGMAATDAQFWAGFDASASASSELEVPGLQLSYSEQASLEEYPLSRQSDIEAFETFVGATDGEMIGQPSTPMFSNPYTGNPTAPNLVGPARLPDTAEPAGDIFVMIDGNIVRIGGSNNELPGNMVDNSYNDLSFYQSIQNTRNVDDRREVTEALDLVKTYLKYSKRQNGYGY